MATHSYTVSNLILLILSLITVVLKIQQTDQMNSDPVHWNEFVYVEFHSWDFCIALSLARKQKVASFILKMIYYL